MTPTEAVKLLRDAIQAAESLPPETVVISVTVSPGTLTPGVEIHVHDLPPNLGPVKTRDSVVPGSTPITFSSVVVDGVKIFAIRGLE